MKRAVKMLIGLSILFGLSACNDLGICLINCDRFVDTSYGRVIGSSNGQLKRFFGIPYAEPPIRFVEFNGDPTAPPNYLFDNRWKPPQPKIPWVQPLSAKFSLDDLRGCSQWGAPTQITELMDTENCLTLNIFAPDKPGIYPVMVWFHGGGFQTGSGNELQYMTGKLALGDQDNVDGSDNGIDEDRDVVIVTINYRLGPMGFLSLPELTAEQGHSGNYGLMDQIHALNWIKDEIAAFGGNPNNITLFGQSTGAVSICALMASPLSRSDLFHRAIISSGYCDNWEIKTQAEAEAYGVALADKLGCDTPATRLECLRDLTALEIREVIVEEANSADLTDPEDNDVPFFNELYLVDNFADFEFTPHFTLDGHVFDNDLASMLQAPSTVEDVIIGITENDGSLFEAYRDHPFLAEGSYNDYLANRFPDPLPDVDPLVNTVADAISALYPFNTFTTVGEAMVEITTDRLFACTAVRLSDLLASTGYNVYQYQFTQETESLLRTGTIILLGENNNEDLGVIHSSELPFIFGTSGVTGFIGDADAVSENMMNYWTNFARSGDPNTGATVPLWPQYDVGSRQYMNLGENFVVDNNLRPISPTTVCDFWASLSPL